MLADISRAKIVWFSQSIRELLCIRENCIIVLPVNNSRGVVRWLLGPHVCLDVINDTHQGDPIS